MIAKFVNDKKEAWSDFLDTSVFAYNTSRHASSQFTPFELMFNRRAAIPIDIELRKEMSKDLATGYIELPEPDPAVVEEKRKKRLEEAKENILHAQKKQKEQYDKKHAKPHLFQPGQLVLKKDFTRRKRKGGKLDLKYLGPYTIVEELGKGTYLLALVGRPEEKVQATGAHLKSYATPEDPPNNPESPVPVPESPVPAPESPVPVPESPVPVPESPVPAPESPVPVPESPVPVPESPVPAPESPVPVPESPVPVPESPVPVPESPVPAPESPVPVPESPVPVPESPVPAPESPVPVPESPVPAPIHSSTPIINLVQSSFELSYGKLLYVV